MNEPFFIEKTIKKLIAEQKEQFNGNEEEFERIIEEKMPKIIENILKDVSEELFKYCFSEENDLKKHERKIKKRIEKNYGAGIKLFEAFIELNSKISVSTYEKYFDTFKNKINDQLKLDTLISIHARACQIANEIKVLISNGYADGALSRWRTIHELSITFLFIYDNDYRITEMYNDYQSIENWKKVKEFQEHHKHFGWKPFSKKDVSQLEEEKDEMIEKYGKEFGQSYGWTMDILPKGRRNIRELEKSVDKQHYRPIYMWASENVHSGVSAIRKKVGLREYEQDYLLTYSNDYGFLEAVEFTSSTLTIMSETLLDMEDSYMNKITKELLYYLQNELVEHFASIEKIE